MNSKYKIYFKLFKNINILIVYKEHCCRSRTYVSDTLHLNILAYTVVAKMIRILVFSPAKKTVLTDLPTLEGGWCVGVGVSCLLFTIYCFFTVYH